MLAPFAFTSHTITGQGKDTHYITPFGPHPIRQHAGYRMGHFFDAGVRFAISHSARKPGGVLLRRTTYPSGSAGNRTHCPRMTYA